MKKRLSKTFVGAITVLCIGLYVGAYAYASESISLKSKGNDELEHTIKELKEDNEVELTNDSMLVSGISVDNITEIESGIAQKKEELEQQELEEKYGKMAIAKTDSSINVRKDASTDSEVVGKLYNGAFVSILGETGDWYKIESGLVEGYSKKEYFTKGTELGDSINDYAKSMAIIDVDSTKLKMEAEDDSDDLTELAKGEQYEIVKTEGNWILIKLSSELQGYVKKTDVKQETTYRTAVSNSEESKIAEAVRAKIKIKQEKESSNSTETTQGEGAQLNASDKDLLTALVFCESGMEPYEGKLAVANVVINRVNSGKYPNSISGVIYQSGQFGPASNGQLSKNLSLLKNGGFTAKNHKESIQAVEAAMSGSNNIGSCTSFNTSTSASNAKKIGNHYFW